MTHFRRWGAAAGKALVAALAAAHALPASATTTFEGSISSTLGDVFVLLSPPRPGPVDASDSGCSSNQCGFGRLDGADGRQHINLSEQAGYLAQPVSVPGSLVQRGQMRVVATGSNAPSFVDFTFDLWLDGSTSGGNAQGTAVATVGASFAIQGLVGGGGSGQYRVSQAWNTSAPPPLLVGFTLIGDHVLRGTLTHVAVGQWFELDTTLSGQVSTSGEARASINYSLSPVPSGMFAQLPAGLTLESPDWAIADNHWCPSGCAPVPEAPTSLLALLGLALTAARVRLRRRAGAPSRP